MDNKHIKLGLENFRIFSDYHEFDFAPFTILTGPNNSGKSTLHRALYMMTNSFKKDGKGRIDFETLSFNEISDKIGDFEANLSYNNNSSTIILGFTFKSKYIDEVFNVKLKYNQNETTKRVDLIEIEFNIQDDSGKYYTLFTLIQKFNPTWQIQSFNYYILRYLLKSLREKGAEQEMILELCSKLKNKENTLTKDDKKRLDDLKKKGLILNPGAEYHDDREAIDVSIPKDWDVYYRKNKKHYRYSQDYKKAYDLLTTPFEDLVIDSDFLYKIDELKYFNNQEQNISDDKTTNELVSMLIKENIFNSNIESFIEKYQEFENNLFFELFSEINLDMSSSIGQMYGEIHSPFTYLNDFMKYAFGEYKKQWVHLKENMITKDPPEFNKYILENQFWGKSYTISDLFDHKMQGKKIGGGRLNDSLDGILYFIHLFWEEFTDNLNTFITKTRLLLFDTNIKRHLLFDESTKFQSTLTRYAKQQFSGRKDDDSAKFIRRWLKKFHLGSSLEVEKITAGKELIGAEFFLRKKNRKVPLGDNGMGTNQLLLLILQIATNPKNSRFLLEEPEASLHPAFQSMLAEMFVDARKTFGHSFVIETHSEYLIRKLQFLTARKIITADDTRIYYFNHPDFVPEDEKLVKLLTIRPDGLMDEDFGTGFFDESTRLTMDLLKLQNRN